MSFVSIDPGINNTGICSFYIDNGIFTIHKTRLVNNVRKFTDEEKATAKMYGDRLPRILYIKKLLLEMIDEANKKEQVEGIIAEAPFYSSLRPQTFGSIVEILCVIKLDVAYLLNLPFSAIEPLYIKKHFTKVSLADKGLMKQVLIDKINNKEIMSEIDVATISEHEIDAVAIGYVQWLMNIKDTKG